MYLVLSFSIKLEKMKEISPPPRKGVLQVGLIFYISVKKLCMQILRQQTEIVFKSEVAFSDG